MSEAGESMELRILAAVRHTLAGVVRDTATPHGMRHPLTDATIEDLRQCLALISARERELAQAAGPVAAARPVFADAPTGEAKVIQVHPRKGPVGPR
ncbi:MAG: segregation and condensation protein A [Proteobacteria bacterium]|nr:segregation and condensation protein A [Pseudomonadota bacterium]